MMFVSDLHGSETTFAKVLGAMRLWEADVLVCGGDVAGKVLWPVIVEGGRRRLRWMGEVRSVEADEYAEITRAACQMGFYPLELEEDELAELQADDTAMDAEFERLIAERWAAWLDRLEARCAELRIPAYVIAGNDDPWSLDEVTFQDREWVQAADGRVLPLHGHEGWSLLSCGLANPTPWLCPRDVGEDELARRLGELAADVPDLQRTVANIHVPPYGTGIDAAPELDTSVDPPQPVFGSTVPVGSTAVRDFLIEAQPAASLHGHIHESGGAAQLGRTRAYNPGSEYSEGVLRGVLVTLSDDAVIGHQFVSG
jgi:Icc-related predicted phosphoesterase